MTETVTFDASARRLGTAAGITVAPALTVLEELGIDAEPILRKAELTRDAVQDHDARIPFSCVRVFWEEAAVAAKDPGFGVHVAKRLSFGSNDVFDYLVAASPTLGESLARIVQYVRILYDQSNLHLVLEPLHARLLRSVPIPAAQYEEFILSWLVLRTREATGVDWLPERMTFQHDRPEDVTELMRLFRCPLAFSASSLEMMIPRAALDLPNSAPDCRLIDILMRYANTLLPAAHDDLAKSVASLVARRLGTELPTLASTAAALRIPPRTLQRRLADCGVHFSQLLDDVRRGFATKLVAETRLGIFEVAYLAHFADTSAFQRAFKRWTGGTPGEYRRQYNRTAGQAKALSHAS